MSKQEEYNKVAEQLGLKGAKANELVEALVKLELESNSDSTSQAENEGLKSELIAKSELLETRQSDIETLNTEKSELQAENEGLKEKVADLEKKLEASRSANTRKGKGAKTEKRFEVVSAFRGNAMGENGKIYEVGTDVSDLDAERLKSLVDRELVKEV